MYSSFPNFVSKTTFQWILWLPVFLHPILMSKLAFIKFERGRLNAIAVKMRNRISHHRCPIVKLVLRNFTKFTGKQLCQSLFFNIVADLRSSTLSETDSGTGVFLFSTFPKFLTTPFLQNNSK